MRKKKVYESNTNTTEGYLLPGWMLGAVLLALALYVWGGDTLSSVSAAYSLHRERRRATMRNIRKDWRCWRMKR